MPFEARYYDLVFMDPVTRLIDVAVVCTISLESALEIARAMSARHGDWLVEVIGRPGEHLVFDIDSTPVWSVYEASLEAGDGETREIIIEATSFDAAAALARAMAKPGERLALVTHDGRWVQYNPDPPTGR